MEARVFGDARLKDPGRQDLPSVVTSSTLAALMAGKWSLTVPMTREGTAATGRGTASLGGAEGV